MAAASDSLVVMYQYVRPSGGTTAGGIRPLPAHDFERQLDWLSARYDIVHPGPFLARIRSGATGRPACLLTFDDGTRDHAEVVTPILQRRGLGGVFFVLTWPCEVGRMPMTHAVHWLLSHAEEQVWAAFERYACARLGGLSALGDATTARRTYSYETPLRARIRYAANMALPPDATARIVQECLAGTGRSMGELAREWFVSAPQIAAMHAAGMTIGIHGCSHQSLQVLGPGGIRGEIRHSSDYIASLTGERPTWFACPFGGYGAAPDTVAAMRGAMEEVGVLAAVSTVKSLVPAGCDPFAIPRLEATDLPPCGHWLEQIRRSA